MPQALLFGEAERAQELDQFLRVQRALSFDQRGKLRMVFQRAEERLVVPHLQKLIEGKLLQACHPDEVLVPPRFFFFFSGEPGMARKNDDFVDRRGMLFFELHRASAAHRIADEMARLRDVFFLEV